MASSIPTTAASARCSNGPNTYIDATGDLTPVTVNPYGEFDTQPQYSPDGAQITFTRVKNSQRVGSV